MHRVYPAAGQAPLGPHKSFYNVVVDLDKRDAIKFGGTSFIPRIQQARKRGIFVKTT